MTVDKKIDKPEEIVDYTTEMGIKDINIINNFLHFKENVKKEIQKLKYQFQIKQLLLNHQKILIKKHFL